MGPCVDQLFSATLNLSLGAALAAGARLADYSDERSGNTAEINDSTTDCDSCYNSGSVSPPLCSVAGETPRRSNGSPHTEVPSWGGLDAIDYHLHLLAQDGWDASAHRFLPVPKLGIAADRWTMECLSAINSGNIGVLRLHDANSETHSHQLLTSEGIREQEMVRQYDLPSGDDAVRNNRTRASLLDVVCHTYHRSTVDSCRTIAIDQSEPTVERELAHAPSVQPFGTGYPHGSDSQHHIWQTFPLRQEQDTPSAQENHRCKPDTLCASADHGSHNIFLNSGEEKLLSAGFAVTTPVIKGCEHDIGLPADNHPQAPGDHPDLATDNIILVSGEEKLLSSSFAIITPDIKGCENHVERRADNHPQAPGANPDLATDIPTKTYSLEPPVNTSTAAARGESITNCQSDWRVTQAHDVTITKLVDPWSLVLPSTTFSFRFPKPANVGIPAQKKMISLFGLAAPPSPSMMDADHLCSDQNSSTEGHLTPDTTGGPCGDVPFQGTHGSGDGDSRHVARIGTVPTGDISGERPTPGLPHTQVSTIQPEAPQAPIQVGLRVNEIPDNNVLVIDGQTQAGWSKDLTLHHLDQRSYNCCFEGEDVEGHGGNDGTGWTGNLLSLKSLLTPFEENTDIIDRNTSKGVRRRAAPLVDVIPKGSCRRSLRQRQRWRALRLESQ